MFFHFILSQLFNRSKQTIKIQIKIETKLQIIRSIGSQCSDDVLLPAGRGPDDGQGSRAYRQNTCLRRQNSEGHHLCRNQRREPAQCRRLYALRRYSLRRYRGVLRRQSQQGDGQRRGASDPLSERQDDQPARKRRCRHLCSRPASQRHQSRAHHPAQLAEYRLHESQ